MFRSQTRGYPPASEGFSAGASIHHSSRLAGLSLVSTRGSRVPENRGVAGSIPALAIRIAKRFLETESVPDFGSVGPPEYWSLRFEPQTTLGLKNSRPPEHRPVPCRAISSVRSRRVDGASSSLFRACPITALRVTEQQSAVRKLPLDLRGVSRIVLEKQIRPASRIAMAREVPAEVPVCPECGERAGFLPFCRACGLNLTAVKRLPTLKDPESEAEGRVSPDDRWVIESSEKEHAVGDISPTISWLARNPACQAALQVFADPSPALSEAIQSVASRNPAVQAKLPALKAAAEQASSRAKSRGPDAAVNRRSRRGAWGSRTQPAWSVELFGSTGAQTAAGMPYIPGSRPLVTSLLNTPTRELRDDVLLGIGVRRRRRGLFGWLWGPSDPDDRYRTVERTLELPELVDTWFNCVEVEDGVLDLAAAHLPQQLHAPGTLAAMGATALLLRIPAATREGWRRWLRPPGRA